MGTSDLFPSLPAPKPDHPQAVFQLCPEATFRNQKNQDQMQASWQDPDAVELWFPLRWNWAAAGVAGHGPVCSVSREAC